MIGPYKYIEKSIMAVRPILQKYPIPIRDSGINLTDLRNLSGFGYALLYCDPKWGIAGMLTKKCSGTGKKPIPGHLKKR